MGKLLRVRIPPRPPNGEEKEMAKKNKIEYKDMDSMEKVTFHLKRFGAKIIDKGKIRKPLVTLEQVGDDLITITIDGETREFYTWDIIYFSELLSDEASIFELKRLIRWDE